MPITYCSIEIWRLDAGFAVLADVEPRAHRLGQLLEVRALEQLADEVAARREHQRRDLERALEQRLASAPDRRCGCRSCRAPCRESTTSNAGRSPSSSATSIDSTSPTTIRAPGGGDSSGARSSPTRTAVLADLLARVLQPRARRAAEIEHAMTARRRSRASRRSPRACRPRARGSPRASPSGESDRGACCDRRARLWPSGNNKRPDAWSAGRAAPAPLTYRERRSLAATRSGLLEALSGFFERTSSLPMPLRLYAVRVAALVTTTYSFVAPGTAPRTRMQFSSARMRNSCRFWTRDLLVAHLAGHALALVDALRGEAAADRAAVAEVLVGAVGARSCRTCGGA